MIVDKNGFLMAIMVTVANAHYSKALFLLMITLHYFLTSVKVFPVDGGCSGEIIEQVKNNFGYLIHVVMSSDSVKKEFSPSHKDGL